MAFESMAFESMAFESMAFWLNHCTLSLRCTNANSISRRRRKQKIWDLRHLSNELVLCSERFCIKIGIILKECPLYNKQKYIHGCLEIPDLFLVLNMISHLFNALTREISCSTLSIY